ncbi:ester cyclase [Granulicella sibirica]|uniref:Ester cyclase n=1 Tax=Granulicella sibirica TaxID=2479048 RepID=A0A4Q0T2L6_9BACT|nr:ester cyclase [Granulicella sibirica]RXH57082.1 Protein of unknown function DUF1486 [Granulicella sibirica]
MTTSNDSANRESIVKAHIKAVTESHDAPTILSLFTRVRYEIPALASIIEGPEAATHLYDNIFSAFPDFYMEADTLHHAEEAIIAEVTFGGTQHGVWAGVQPAGKKAVAKGVLIFVFEGDGLVCEKVFFDHGTLLRQLTAA